MAVETKTATFADPRWGDEDWIEENLEAIEAINEEMSDEACARRQEIHRKVVMSLIRKGHLTEDGEWLSESPPPPPWWDEASVEERREWMGLGRA